MVDNLLFEHRKMFINADVSFRECTSTSLLELIGVSALIYLYQRIVLSINRSRHLLLQTRQGDIRRSSTPRACLHCDGKLRGLGAGLSAAGAPSNQLCWPRKSQGLRLLAVSSPPLAICLLRRWIPPYPLLVVCPEWNGLSFFLSFATLYVYLPRFSCVFLSTLGFPPIFSSAASLLSGTGV